MALRRLTPGYAPGPPYDLVVGDIFTILPFGNAVLTRTVTGTQLWAILEWGVAAFPPGGGRFPQTSGFRFTFDSSKPVGSRIVSVTLNDGTVIHPDATTYTFATNDFTNAGGDGYTMLADGQGITREVMANVVQEYVTALGTVSPLTDGRILDVKP
jgi:5'-nucleotidase